jgi:hypothetical protein
VAYTGTVLVFLVVALVPVLIIPTYVVVGSAYAFMLYRTLTVSLRQAGTAPFFAMLSLGVVMFVVFMASIGSLGQVAMETSEPCTGIVSGAGECTPLEQLPPVVQTSVARGTPVEQMLR